MTQQDAELDPMTREAISREVSMARISSWIAMMAIQHADGKTPLSRLADTCLLYAKCFHNHAGTSHPLGLLTKAQIAEIWRQDDDALRCLTLLHVAGVVVPPVMWSAEGIATLRAEIEAAAERQAKHRVAETQTAAEA